MQSGGELFYSVWIILSLLGRRCLFQIFWNISAPMRTWVMLWPGCGLIWDGLHGGGQGRRRRPCLPRQLWGAPSWVESPFCPQPSEPDVPLHINSQFIVGFHWFWLQRSVFREDLLPVVVARVLQAMLEKSTGKEVLPLKHPNNPHHSQMRPKWRFLALFLGLYLSFWEQNKDFALPVVEKSFARTLANAVTVLILEHIWTPLCSSHQIHALRTFLKSGTLCKLVMELQRQAETCLECNLWSLWRACLGQ